MSTIQNTPKAPLPKGWNEVLFGDARCEFRI